MSLSTLYHEHTLHSTLLHIPTTFFHFIREVQVRHNAEHLMRKKEEERNTCQSLAIVFLHKRSVRHIIPNYTLRCTWQLGDDTVYVNGTLVYGNIFATRATHSVFFNVVGYYLQNSFSEGSSEPLHLCGRVAQVSCIRSHPASHNKCIFLTVIRHRVLQHRILNLRQG